MILKIQLLQVLRNKRFLIFTILVPAFWFLVLINIPFAKGALLINLVLGLTSVFGILGNSLTTFSKRISTTSDFYAIRGKTSYYSNFRFLLDQTIVQTVLNFLIFLIMVILGVVLSQISMSKTVIIIGVLSLWMGLYFSVIGFFLGTNFNAQMLDAASFPFMILGSLMIVPINIYNSTNIFMQIIASIQKIFPGYYYIDIINKATNHVTVPISSISYLILTSVVTLGLVTILINKSPFRN
ncbi:ABC transporter [Leuconostoc citreum]|uniref:ABC transporter n=1 Tax=Leuconostoc citreum TaxID=33964 RepID=UPI0032E04C24